jgi:hypothetical protein
VVLITSPVGAPIRNADRHERWSIEDTAGMMMAKREFEEQSMEVAKASAPLGHLLASTDAWQ